MTIDYNHSRNLHTVNGAAAALDQVFRAFKPKSLLDVGCGGGTWLKAASAHGIIDLFGVDGILVDQSELHIPRNLIEQRDLSQPFYLGRRFDLAICLEVAEHLPSSSSGHLIKSLTDHADTVLFSAACPGQPGQHHINCQWPEYWQEKFNLLGYACDESIRWNIWQDERIEPWYRQNIFWARRDAARSGAEPRLNPVIHPDLLLDVCNAAVIPKLENGLQPTGWYLRTALSAATAKIRRKIASGNL
jgi:SAM-dependent methyltransferase